MHHAPGDQHRGRHAWHHRRCALLSLMLVVWCARGHRSKHHGRCVLGVHAERVCDMSPALWTPCLAPRQVGAVLLCGRLRMIELHELGPTMMA